MASVRGILEGIMPSFEAPALRSRRSGQLHRSVVVAMIAVRMMQPSAHDVIDVITMGHGFVSAGWPMLVRTARLRGALDGIVGVDRDGVLIDMILVRVMKVAIMEIIDVAVMADRRMPTVGTMLVGMVGMMLLGAGGHDVFVLLRLRSEGTGGYGLSAACSMALSTKCSPFPPMRCEYGNGLSASARAVRHQAAKNRNSTRE